LAELAKSYLLAEAVIERVARWIDRDALQALLRGVQVDLTRRDLAEASVESLAAALPANGVHVSSHFDPKTERHQVRIERTRHGNVRVTAIDSEFVHLATTRRSARRRRCCAGWWGSGPTCSAASAGSR
jgi:DNA gyrase subunit B